MAGVRRKKNARSRLNLEIVGIAAIGIAILLGIAFLCPTTPDRSAVGPPLGCGISLERLLRFSRRSCSCSAASRFSRSTFRRCWPGAAARRSRISSSSSRRWARRERRLGRRSHLGCDAPFDRNAGSMDIARRYCAGAHALDYGNEPKERYRLGDRGVRAAEFLESQAAESRSRHARGVDPRGGSLLAAGARAWTFVRRSRRRRTS